jgi:Transposase DDE domain group 1
MRSGLCGGGVAVGERQEQPFQLSFNGRLRVDFQGARVTSDGGLLLVRELDERLGFGELIERHLTDGRAKNTQLPLTDLVRQSVCSRLAGYEDVNDAERLSQDPAFRLIGSEKVLERGAALTSRLQSFETELLTQRENLAGLARISRDLIAKAEVIDSAHRVVLDMDSTEVPVYGRQEQSAYNGHFESTCYHPLLLQPRGRLPGGETTPRQRPQRRGLGGTAAARDRAPTAARQGCGLSCRHGLRQAGDLRVAGRTQGEIHHPPSRQRQSEAQGCAVADPASGKAELQPMVRYRSFFYQAASWKSARRVVAKVEFHFGELFPRVGFIVTNLSAPNRAVVRFYNKRGMAEQWIKEGKQAVAMTRLSCHRFRANEVRLWLSLIAYNLGNLWRRLALPAPIGKWSLTSLQQRVVKTGGRLIKHASYYWLLLAESHLTRRLFGTMLRRVAMLPVPAG